MMGRFSSWPRTPRPKEWFRPLDVAANVICSELIFDFLVSRVEFRLGKIVRNLSLDQKLCKLAPLSFALKWYWRQITRSQSSSLVSFVLIIASAQDVTELVHQNLFTSPLLCSRPVKCRT